MTSAIVTHERGFFGRTGQPEKFQEIIGDVVRPAQVRAERAGRYDFRMNHLRFERLHLTALSYGDVLEVDLPEGGVFARDSMVLQVVLTGSAHTWVDSGGPIAQSPSSAHLAACALPLRVRCHRNCRHLLVRVDRSVLERTADEFAQAIHWPDPRSEFSLAGAGGRALRRYVRYLVGEIDDRNYRDLGGCVTRAAEQSLLAHIVSALHDSALGRARDLRRAHGLTGAARRAVEFIEAHLQDDIGLRDIVASSGASLRSLYRSFERAHGTSPMAYLRQRRLQEAHTELLSADPGTVRVTDVALRWGFAHLSDFALRYRESYGCLPSETLRRH
jgi:AraC-like DNA-binding protein